MNKSYFIKSYSKGQLTIPKEVRDSMGLGDDFWLELTMEGNKLTIKPLKDTNVVREPSTGADDYAKMLKNLDTSWFDEEQYKKLKDDLAKRKDLYE